MLDTIILHIFGGFLTPAFLDIPLLALEVAVPASDHLQFCIEMLASDNLEKNVLWRHIPGILAFPHLVSTHVRVGHFSSAACAQAHSLVVHFSFSASSTMQSI